MCQKQNGEFEQATGDAYHTVLNEFDFDSGHSLARFPKKFSS